MTNEKADLTNQQSDAEKDAALKAAAETSKAAEQSKVTSKANEQPPSDADLKAELEREKAENARLKEFERGTQEKLRKLAEIEKQEQVRIIAQTPDEIGEIDSQIIELDKAIFAHKNHRNDLGDPEPLYAGHLEIQKKGLERDKRNTIKAREDGAFQAKYTQITENHPEFTDFNGLNAIILEYHKKGENISPTLAYDFYDARQKAKIAAQSAQITAEGKLLGDKAAGQGGGKPATVTDQPTTGEKERKRLFGV